MNIAICDDEKKVCEELKGFTLQAQKDLCTQIDCSVFNDAQELLSSSKKFDVLLLDIKMNALSGMDAARILRSSGYKGKIVFITSMVSYALEGYEVHAFGFLKKPVSYPRFLRIISECNRARVREQGTTFEFRYGTQTQIVETDDIIYIESFNHDINVICLDGLPVIHTSSTLTDLEKALKSANFFRCHRSYLINLKYIRGIGPDTIEMLNGTHITLSKYKKKEFLSAFTNYRGGII